MNRGVKTESERKYRSSHLTENFKDLIEVWDIDKCVFCKCLLLHKLSCDDAVFGIKHDDVCIRFIML